MRFTYFEIQARARDAEHDTWQTVPVGYHVRPRPHMACAGFEERQSAQTKIEELRANPSNAGWLYRINEVLLDIRTISGEVPRPPERSIYEYVAAAIQGAMQRRELLRYEVSIRNDCVFVAGRSVYTADGLDLGLVHPMLDVEERLKAVIEHAVAEHRAQHSG